MGTKVKTKTHAIIDYFEPLKVEAEGNIMTNNIITNQFTNLYKMGERLTGEKPNFSNKDTKYDQLGYLNFTGIVKKRRGNLNKFHDRFVMVRGFDILWFAVDDSATSGRFKEKVPLPSIRVDFDVMVGKLKCYTLQKQADLENSRVLTF